jgi:hypothetical protein
MPEYQAAILVRRHSREYLRPSRVPRRRPLPSGAVDRRHAARKFGKQMVNSGW